MSKNTKKIFIGCEAYHEQKAVQLAVNAGVGNPFLTQRLHLLLANPLRMMCCTHSLDCEKKEITFTIKLLEILGVIYG